MDSINQRKLINNITKIKFIMLLRELSIFLLFMYPTNGFASDIATEANNEEQEVKDLRIKISFLTDELLLLSENDKYKGLVEKISQKSENIDNIGLLRSLVLIMEHMQEDGFISKNEPFMFHFNVHMMESIYHGLIEDDCLYSDISHEEVVVLSLDTLKEIRSVIYPRVVDILNEFRKEKIELLDSLKILYAQSLAIENEKQALLARNLYDTTAITLLENTSHSLYFTLQKFENLINRLGFNIADLANGLMSKRLEAEKKFIFDYEPNFLLEILKSDIKSKIWNHMFYLLSSSSGREKFLSVLDETKKEELIDRTNMLIHSIHSIAETYRRTREYIRNRDMAESRYRG